MRTLANNVRKACMTMGVMRNDVGMTVGNMTVTNTNTPKSMSSSTKSMNSLAFMKVAKSRAMSGEGMTIHNTESIHQVAVVDESTILDIASTVSPASYDNVVPIEEDTIAEDAETVVDSLADWVPIQQGVAINKPTIVDISTVSAAASFISDSIDDDVIPIVRKMAWNVLGKANPMSLAEGKMSMSVAVSAVVVAFSSFFRNSSAVVE